MRVSVGALAEAALGAILVAVAFVSVGAFAIYWSSL